NDMDHNSWLIGYIAVYRVKEPLLGRGNGMKTGLGQQHRAYILLAILMHYFPVHQNAIQSLSWIRAPSTSAKGDYLLRGDPTYICSNGSEGTVKITDVRDGVPRLLVRNREVPHSNAYSSFCGTLVSTDVDFWVKMFQLQPATFGKGHLMVDVGGAAMWALQMVLAQPQTSYEERDVRGQLYPLLNHKIFQLDYSPETEAYRMLDHFLPQESGTSEGPG
ncbi:16204_t:CDS:2, partial [Acaulospora colombiana]